MEVVVVTVPLLVVVALEHAVFAPLVHLGTTLVLSVQCWRPVGGGRV